MATGHMITPFDEELDTLRGTVCEMGGIAEQAIIDAMEALVRGDLDAARRVVERDRRIDALETEIETKVVEIIASRSPSQEELREVVAALKIAGVVERIGDYAKNIAKRVPSVEDSHVRPVSLLPEMARIASEMVHNVLDAFAARDPDKARQVRDRDVAVDDFYNSIFRALLTHMMENPHNITPAILSAATTSRRSSAIGARNAMICTAWRSASASSASIFLSRSTTAAAAALSRRTSA